MKVIKPDFSKSLQQLENIFWEDYAFPTPLIEKAHIYRKIPINDLLPSEIRLLIGQNIGLQFLIPKAIEILEIDILTDADFYEGDLLSAILTCDKDYWSNHKEIKQRVRTLLSDKISEIENQTIDNSLRQVIKKINKFRQSEDLKNALLYC
ncbi:MAG: contact-dependent growth inhibition system immunity protein [Bacteroidota bacterium]